MLLLSPFAQPQELAGFTVRRVRIAGRTILLQFDPVWIILLVLHRGVVSLFAICASKGDNFAHPKHLPEQRNELATQKQKNPRNRGLIPASH